MSFVVIVAATCRVPLSFCGNLHGCVLLFVGGGDVESSVSVSSTRAHTLTHQKDNKNFCTCYQRCCRN
jgi:hypothetical protein